MAFLLPFYIFNYLDYERVRDLEWKKKNPKLKLKQNEKETNPILFPFESLAMNLIVVNNYNSH